MKACNELSRLIRNNPEAVRHVPEALNFLVADINCFETDAPEVSQLVYIPLILVLLSLSAETTLKRQQLKFVFRRI